MGGGVVGVKELIEIIGNAGLMVALVAFFVWQNSREKEALTKRINEVENFNRDQMSGMVKETTAALTNTSTAVTDCTRAVEDNSELMRRLCGHFDKHEGKA